MEFNRNQVKHGKIGETNLQVPTFKDIKIRLTTLKKSNFVFTLKQVQKEKKKVKFMYF